MIPRAWRTVSARVLAPVLLAAASVCGQIATDTPPELEGVGIEPPADAQVPVDLGFIDEEGRPVRLSDWFNKDKPVVLTLGYYRCPMLCGLLLNGFTDALRELAFSPGDEFEIVTVTIDPRETWSLAKAKKENYLGEYGRAGVGGGWHFLTGSEESIKALADSVGFMYRYDEKTDQFAHATGLFILTPEGRLSRFLSGVLFEPRTLRLALVEASEGKVGTTFDRFLMTCFHYDPGTGRYGMTAFRMVQAGGILTVVLLVAFVGALSVVTAKRRKTPAPEETEDAR